MPSLRCSGIDFPDNKLQRPFSLLFLGRSVSGPVEKLFSSAFRQLTGFSTVLILRRVTAESPMTAQSPPVAAQMPAKPTGGTISGDANCATVADAGWPLPPLTEIAGLAASLLVSLTALALFWQNLIQINRPRQSNSLRHRRRPRGLCVKQDHCCNDEA